MRGILDLLRPDSLLLLQQIGSKKRALEVLSTALAGGLETTGSRTLLDLLTARERLGSTGLGGGVAIPHCRIPDGTHSSAAILTLTKGVDFDAVDGQPVDVFVALAVPSEAEDIHLQYLKELAEILDSPEHLKTLRASRQPEPLLAALSQP
ncbi:MAG: PTS sugar transporter subunit IIA [Gammaproteobacteria bacterium]|nr:PTS sugar transporter subunit IIA [Gammaproteobacteria bacterium]MDE0611511.1 PTS sugar transporter subunit IIA [Gammaproteobacteria bacterium]